MLLQWQNDREHLGQYPRELVPLATERTQATLAAYRGAKASLIDALVARRAEIDVRNGLAARSGHSAPVGRRRGACVAATSLTGLDLGPHERAVTCSANKRILSPGLT